MKRDELFNLDKTLAKFILAKLKAFKKAKRHCYNSATPKSWERILKEMIFAFDYHLNSDKKSFYKKWNIKDPFAKDKNNLIVQRLYELPGGSMMMCYNNEEPPQKGLLSAIEKMYYNCHIYEKHSKRCDIGLKLFSKYFTKLWD